MRSATLRIARPLAQPTRLFSSSIRAMAEGDISKGPQGDAFAKREHAQEEIYIQQQEREKLRALHEKLETQERSIADLKKNIKTMLNEGDASTSGKK